MDLIIGRFLTPLNSSRTMRSVRAGVTTTRAGKCRMSVWTARQDVTGADRRWAQQYEPGDVVRYTTGSKALAVQAGDYARVERVHTEENRLTVTRGTGTP